MDPLRMLPLNPRDFLILLALSDGKLHGYGIVKAAQSQAGGGVRLDPANLYRSLKRMVRTALVEEADPDPDDGSDAARRRYYAITDVGRSVLSAEAAGLATLMATARAKKVFSSVGLKTR